MSPILVFAATLSLVSAHGILKSMTVDGTTYPSFDPRVDPKFGSKRIDWGYSITDAMMNARGFGPVADVTSPDITCRFNPLNPPALHAVARAGANITFQWTDWFTNHKGPLLTYMGLMEDENAKPQTVKFFKIDEATYDPKSMTWGTDWLISNNNKRTVTIPSDIKPGMYVVRHELISLHFAFRPNNQSQTSGAQFFPQCSKVQVLGDGNVVPPGETFPGTYKWDEPGILDNIYYGVNRYISPGPQIYKGPGLPPKGPRPIVVETGELMGVEGERYKAEKAKSDKTFEDIVHADSDNKHGGGGCHWEEGADSSTAKCVPTNPGMDAYVGFAQPKGSPMYTDKPGSASFPPKGLPKGPGARVAVGFMA